MEKQFKNIEITMTLIECEQLRLELKKAIKDFEDTNEAMGAYFSSESFIGDYPKINELLKVLGATEEMPF